MTQVLTEDELFVLANEFGYAYSEMAEKMGVRPLAKKGPGTRWRYSTPTSTGIIQVIS